jgi:hypothetical protein
MNSFVSHYKIDQLLSERLSKVLMARSHNPYCWLVSVPQVEKLQSPVYVTVQISVQFCNICTVWQQEVMICRSLFYELG